MVPDGAQLLFSPQSWSFARDDHFEFINGWHNAAEYCKVFRLIYYTLDFMKQTDSVYPLVIWEDVYMRELSKVKQRGTQGKFWGDSDTTYISVSSPWAG